MLNEILKKIKNQYGHWHEIEFRIGKFFYDFPGRWWLSYRFIPHHRYHIVNTGLSPNYYDPDRRILHSIMSIFCEWYEDSDHCIRVEDFKDRDDEGSQTYLEANKEFFEAYERIYDWWTKEVKKDEWDWIWRKCYINGEFDHKLEESMEQEITDNLMTLMKYRTHFWF